MAGGGQERSIGWQSSSPRKIAGSAAASVGYPDDLLRNAGDLAPTPVGSSPNLGRIPLPRTPVDF
jgi:hypothetical protein